MGEHVHASGAAQYAPEIVYLRRPAACVDASVGASILGGLNEMSTVNRRSCRRSCPVRSPAPTEPRISSQVGLTKTRMRWYHKVLHIRVLVRARGALHVRLQSASRRLAARQG